MFKVQYWWRGERHTTSVSNRNELRLDAMLEKLAKHGYSKHYVPSEMIETNPLVVALQDFRKSGEEYAVVMQTRGRFRGARFANIYRTDSDM